MAVFCQRSSAGVDVWGPWFDQTGPRSAGGSIRVELSAVRVGLMAEKDWVCYFCFSVSVDDYETSDWSTKYGCCD